ncbi:unnamed protein product [Caenorhabditis nigoni]
MSCTWPNTIPLDKVAPFIYYAMTSKPLYPKQESVEDEEEEEEEKVVEVGEASEGVEKGDTGDTSKVGETKKTWADLPIDFKKQMALTLDEKSKTDFQLSCKDNKAVVDGNPVHLTRVKIMTQPKRWFRHTKFVCEKTQKANKYQPTTESASIKLHRNDAAELLMRCFKNSNSQVNHLWIQGNDKAYQGMPKYLARIMGRVEDRQKEGYTALWKVRWLSWIDVAVENDMFAEFIAHLDPKYLKTLYINNSHVDMDELKYVMRMEQWRGLKELKITFPVTFDLQYFYQFSKLEIMVSKLLPLEFADFMKNFMATHATNMAYFVILSDQNIIPGFKEYVCQQFEPYPFDDGKVEDIDQMNQNPCRRFKLPGSKDHVLMVNFGQKAVIGNVSRENLVANAMALFMTKLNIKTTKTWDV